MDVVNHMSPYQKSIRKEWARRNVNKSTADWSSVENAFNLLK